VAKPLPPAYLDEPYHAEILAVGGVRPYEYSDPKPGLIEGLTFKAGVIEGKPKKKGLVRFEVTVKDAALSAVTRTFVLKVTDPPPPTFQFVLPPTAIESPFIWITKLKGRSTLGFQARFALSELRPELSTLKVTDQGLYLVRYDPATRVLGLDLVFFKPVSKGEVFRLTLVPPAKVEVSSIPYRARFLNAKGEWFPASKVVKLEQGEGRYGFKDLLALARNWQQKGAKGEALAGDLNQDGVVNQADWDLLRRDYRWEWWNPEKEHRSKSGYEEAPHP